MTLYLCSICKGIHDSVEPGCTQVIALPVPIAPVADVESATAEAIASWLEQGMADGSLVGLTLNELAERMRAGRWRKP